MTTTAPPARTSGASPVTRRALWRLQVLLGLLLVLASALPELLGEPNAVRIDDLGAGQWLRHLVGVLELAGGVALLVAPLAGLAAACVVALTPRAHCVLRTGHP